MGAVDVVVVEESPMGGYLWVRRRVGNELSRSPLYRERRYAIRAVIGSNTDGDWTFEAGAND